jgi:hypothetical protein
MNRVVTQLINLLYILQRNNRHRAFPEVNPKIITAFESGQANRTPATTSKANE